MPRPQRKEFAGAQYPATSRGNGRSQIFFTDDDRLRFIEQLIRCLEQYDVVLYLRTVRQRYRRYLYGFLIADNVELMEVLKVNGHTSGSGLAKSVAFVPLRTACHDC